MCMMAFSVSPSILLDVPHHASHCSKYIYIPISLNMLPSAQIKKIILFFLFWHPSRCTHCPPGHQCHPSACFLTPLLPPKKKVFDNISIVKDDVVIQEGVCYQEWNWVVGDICLVSDNRVYPLTCCSLLQLNNAPLHINHVVHQVYSSTLEHVLNRVCNLHTKCAHIIVKFGCTFVMSWNKFWIFNVNMKKWPYFNGQK